MNGRHILLVEDNRFSAHLLKKKIEAESQFEVVWTALYSETEQLLNCERYKFCAALLDYNLPDAPNGKILDLVLARRIPSVVFTGAFSDDVRDMVWNKRVVDYVVKEGPQNVEYVVALLKRIKKNHSIKVLVVEDSTVYLTHIKELLEAHCYRVLVAKNGVEAIQVIGENRDIKLIILDYNMPSVNGFELANRIRQKYPKNEMAIIGMSAHGNSSLPARFIKNGANDFIYKPFTSEEFYCRVTQNLEMLEHVQELQELSNKDYLSKLYNRRFFFEEGEKILANAKRNGFDVVFAMIDIDHFKRVNDTYGHDLGDEVIRQVAARIKGRFAQSDIVARLGGEEFCVLSPNTDRNAAKRIFNELRTSVSGLVFESRENPFSVSISVGVCFDEKETLDQMVAGADKLLYLAKKAGRNRVVIV